MHVSIIKWPFDQSISPGTLLHTGCISVILIEVKQVALGLSAGTDPFMPHSCHLQGAPSVTEPTPQTALITDQ